MNILNYNAFILGLLTAMSFYAVNVLFCFFCLRAKIKVIAFGIFFDPWFSLYKRNIKETTFKLGWIPFGGYIKPFGMKKEDILNIKINEFNKPFYSLSLKTKFYFKLIPAFVYLLACVISFIFFSNNQSFISSFKLIINYCYKAIVMMFSNEITKENFIRLTKETISNKSVTAFAFILLSFLFTLLLPLSNLSSWNPDNTNKKLKVVKFFSYIIMFLSFWFVYIKIPKFIFSFFTPWQCFSYFLSFLIGLFLTGLFFFFGTIFFIKQVT